MVCKGRLLMKGGVNMLKKDILIKEVKKLEGKKGYITPEDLLTEAKNPKSPLHSMFEWDNTKAAREYRLWQARQIIDHIKITIEEREVGAYHNLKVVIGNVKRQGYFPINTILSNVDMHKQVLAIAVGELRYWQNKYRDLKELKDLVDDQKLTHLEMSVVKK